MTHPEHFRLAPITALADVPGIDFNDQGEGLGGRSFGVASQLLNVRPRVQLSQGPGASLLGFGMARSSRCHALRR